MYLKEKLSTKASLNTGVNIKYNVFYLFFVFTLLSCNDTIETKKVSRLISGNINQKCEEYFLEEFGIKGSIENEQNYIISLLDVVIDNNQNQKYNRLSFLYLYEEGETTEITRITLGSTDSNNCLFKKYKNGSVKEKIVNKSFDYLYDNIKKSQNHKKSNRVKVFIIDFKQNNSNCFLYKNISTKVLRELKDLTILDD